MSPFSSPPCRNFPHLLPDLPRRGRHDRLLNIPSDGRRPFVREILNFTLCLSDETTSYACNSCWLCSPNIEYCFIDFLFLSLFFFFLVFFFNSMNLDYRMIRNQSVYPGFYEIIQFAVLKIHRTERPRSCNYFFPLQDNESKKGKKEKERRKAGRTMRQD